MNTLLANNFSLVHLLHRIDLPVFLHDHRPDLTETPLAYNILEVEMVATHFDIVKFALALLLYYYFVLFFTLGRELGEINLETILGILAGFLTERGVRPSMLLLSLLLGRHNDHTFLASALLDTQFPT